MASKSPAAALVSANAAARSPDPDHNDQHQEEPAHVDEPSSPPPATFKGRLQLSKFAYESNPSAPSNQAPRRSPRHTPVFSKHASQTTSQTASQAASPSPSAAVSPRKRSHVSSTPSSSTPSSTPKRKRSRTSTGYAPPSTYAHLSLLPDAIAANLLVLFVGLNPGVQTARSGHAYAHPSNLFWKLLYSSGVTPRPCLPEEDRRMPELYSLGLTNIVGRPSRNGSELSKKEMDDGVSALQDKARQWRPETMCIVGKSIWESIWRVRHGRAVGKDFKYGWQDESENMGVIAGTGESAWAGARVFVASSTSGLAASLSKAEKEEIWSGLGAWVKERRRERELNAAEEALA